MESAIIAKEKLKKEDWKKCQKLNIASTARRKLNKITKRKVFDLILLTIPICLASYLARIIFPVQIINQGVSFGINLYSLNVIAPTIVVITFMYPFLVSKDKYLYIGLLLILSGGLCNLFEKFIWGNVFDYINFFNLWYFNIADVLIFFGAFIYIYGQIWKRTD